MKSFWYIAVPMADCVPLRPVVMRDEKGLAQATIRAEYLAREHGTAYAILEYRRTVQKGNGKK